MCVCVCVFVVLLLCIVVVSVLFGWRCSGGEVGLWEGLGFYGLFTNFVNIVDGKA